MVLLVRFPANRLDVLQKVFICSKYYLYQKYCMIRGPKSEMRGIKLLHNNAHVRTTKTWTMWLKMEYNNKIILHNHQISHDVTFVLFPKLNKLLSWRCFHFCSTLGLAIVHSQMGILYFGVQRRIPELAMDYKNLISGLKLEVISQENVNKIKIESIYFWRLYSKSHYSMNSHRTALK